MSSVDRPPSQDELAAMAYADGELAPAERAAFERRLELDPRLAAEVAAQRRLTVLARTFAAPEPMDHEWARVRRSRSQRAMRVAGVALIVSGALVLAVFGEWQLLASALPLLVKLGANAVLAGAILLTLAAWRARVRTLALDPYKDLRR